MSSLANLDSKLTTVSNKIKDIKADLSENLYDFSRNLKGIQGELVSIDENVRKTKNTVDSVSDGVDNANHNIANVHNNVKILYDKLDSLISDFQSYVVSQKQANRRNQAETRLVKIRQELDKKYGHYDIVRRTTTGILQATDLGFIKKSTINNVTEEMMITTPGYWLAPCLVALSAWINDKKELADKAVSEALKRDDEKTSLFWALICRRADRKEASFKWIQRFLANQDEENIDYKTNIIIESYANGLFGSDSEGIVSKQIADWIDKLSSKPGFIEKQLEIWSESITLLKKTYNGNKYKFLNKYSHTWDKMTEVMAGAYLHKDFLSYLKCIFEKKESTDPLKKQLDKILTSLVSDFDKEEIPLRKKERIEQLVVDNDGNEKIANQKMKIEQTAFETHKDFVQMLTDIALKPEITHSTATSQKFAIAVSKEWIITAYNDLVAKNRMNIPNNIEINVDTFNSSTTDGKNEEEILNNFKSLIDSEKESALSGVKLTGFDDFCLYGGWAIALIGVIIALFNYLPFGIIAIISGLGLVIFRKSQEHQIAQARKEIESKFEEKRKAGIEIIKAILAEVVDYRAEFAEQDSISNQVTEFLDQISPEQYVNKLVLSNRKVRL